MGQILDVEPIPIINGEWKVCTKFNTNGSKTLSNSLEGCTEIMVNLDYDNVGYRQTVVIVPMSTFKSGFIFPDTLFASGSGRIYCKMTYVDDTHVTVSEFGDVGGLGASFVLLAR